MARIRDFGDRCLLGADAGFFGRVRRASRTVGFPWPAFTLAASLFGVTLVMFLLCAFGAPLTGNYAATYFAGLLPVLIVEANPLLAAHPILLAADQTALTRNMDRR